MLFLEEKLAVWEMLTTQTVLKGGFQTMRIQDASSWSLLTDPEHFHMVLKHVMIWVVLKLKQEGEMD